MSPEIQGPIMFLICKTSFSTTDQLSTCQAGTARKDEGLVCINFGFSQSVPDRCNEKKSKNKTEFLSPECPSTSSSSLAAGPGSYTDWISSTHTQIHHPYTVSCLLSGAHNIHQAGLLVHSLSSGYLKKCLYCLRAITKQKP